MNEIITSTSNKTIIEAEKLKQKKYVLKTGEFLAESKKVVLELLKSDYTPVCFFLKAETNADYLNGYKTYFVTENVLNKLSSFVTSQNIVGIFKTKNLTPKYEGGKFLILDKIQNPDNMGAIFRTARATGFDQVYLINCVSEFNSKTIRASMGNQFGLKIYQINAEQVKTLFSNAELYCADMSGKNVFEIKNFKLNTGIVIGNEGNGISTEILNLIKQKLSIPMRNNVESLNAGVSASILMYDIMTKTDLKK